MVVKGVLEEVEVAEQRAHKHRNVCTSKHLLFLLLLLFILCRLSILLLVLLLLRLLDCRLLHNESVTGHIAALL